MNGGKIVVFATSFLDEVPTSPPGSGDALALLRSLEETVPGITVEFRCDRDPQRTLTPEEFDGVIAVIADLERYDRPLLERVGAGSGGSLRIIARYGVGLDSVDLDAARDAGIVVTNTPGANTVPTAEWAVATLLDIAGRRLPHHTRAGAGKRKEGPSRLDISGRTLGVVGTGAIGRTVVRLLSGFAMDVLAYDPFPETAWADANGVTYVSFDDLLRRADFVTLHAAAGETIIGARELDLMKPTAALINCARGVLVDNAAAYRAVRDGRLYGYGLDEVWPEPGLPLEGLNIAVSPHVGSDTDGGKVGMQLMSARAVYDFLVKDAS